MFVTSQGHAYARFRRALDSGNPTVALAAASDLPRLDLADALALCLLLRRGDADRYSRSCARWLCRYGLEARGVTLAELQLLAAALAALPATGHDRRPGRALEQLVGARSERLAEAVRRYG